MQPTNPDIDELYLKPINQNLACPLSLITTLSVVYPDICDVSMELVLYFSCFAFCHFTVISSQDLE